MTNDVFIGMRKRKRQYIVSIIIMAIVLALLIYLCLTFGETSGFIITQLRLPRTLAAVFCGMAFAIAGNTFQSLLNNPLASPDIIGVSSGSTVAAVFSILFLNLNRGLVSFISVLSGIFSAFIIYKIAYKDGYSAGRLILTGLGAQAFFNALINWMVMKASEYDVPTAMRWMSGNLNGITIDSLPLLIIVVLITICVIGILGNSLNVMELGENYATVLGVNVNITRTILILCSVILIAFATSISGPIASISFLSGPIARRLCSSNQTNIISSGLIGAILVLASDFIGQFLLPTRYPVGIITGLLGAPYLVYLLIKQNKGGNL